VNHDKVWPRSPTLAARSARPRRSRTCERSCVRTACAASVAAGFRDTRAFYYQRVRAALDWLDTADPPDPKEIGGIPLPVAIGGLKLSAPWTPVAA